MWSSRTAGRYLVGDNRPVIEPRRASHEETCPLRAYKRPSVGAAEEAVRTLIGRGLPTLNVPRPRRSLRIPSAASVLLLGVVPARASALA